MKLLLILLGGIFAGLLMTFFPQLLVVASIFIASFFLFRRLIKGESRSFLLKLLIFGLAVRIAVMFINHFLGLASFYHSGDTQPDATIYNSNAVYVASVIRGPDFLKDIVLEPFVAKSVKLSYEVYRGSIPALGTYQYGIYVYVIGFFYAVFGYAPIAVKLLNCLLGSWIPLVVYFMAMTLTRSEPSAKASAFITMFFPSMILWSASMLQDTLVNFLFMLFSFFIVLYVSGQGRRWAFFALLPLIALSLLKIKIAMLFCAGFVTVLLVNMIRKVFRAKVLLKMVLSMSAVLVSIMVLFSQHVRIASLMNDAIRSIFNIHRVTIESYEFASSFKLYKECMYDLTNSGAHYVMDISMLVSTLKGLCYYFLSPFPWYVPYQHPFLLIFYVQVIFTFICVPFVFVGILVMFRRNAWVMTTLMSFLAIIAIPQVMTEGIIGTVVRHRDMFMPFLFIFAAYGIFHMIDGNGKGRLADMVVS